MLKCSLALYTVGESAGRKQLFEVQTKPKKFDGKIKKNRSIQIYFIRLPCIRFSCSESSKYYAEHFHGRGGGRHVPVVVVRMQLWL